MVAMVVCVWGGMAQPVGVLARELSSRRGAEAGKSRPFRPPGKGQGAACRLAHEGTVAAGAGAGQLPSASAATTFRTFAFGPTAIAPRLS